MRVVLCDDHDLLLEALAFAIGGAGHDVVATCADPAAAVDAVGRFAPDVVLLDQHFPGVAGLHAVAALRRASAGTRIVLLTGLLTRALAREAAAAGVTAVVGKHRPLPDILAAIEPPIPAPAQTERAERTERTERATEGTAARPSRERSPAVPRRFDEPWWVLGFLTDREWDVLRCIEDGASTDEIAERLGVRRATARGHVQHVLEKIGAHSRLQAAALVADYRAAQGLAVVRS